jgi:hypothetical protein
MPRVQMTRMVRVALLSLSIYLVVLLGLLLVRFLKIIQ